MTDATAVTAASPMPEARAAGGGARGGGRGRGGYHHQMQQQAGVGVGRSGSRGGARRSAPLAPGYNGGRGFGGRGGGRGGDGGAVGGRAGGGYLPVSYTLQQQQDLRNQRYLQQQQQQQQLLGSSKSAAASVATAVSPPPAAFSLSATAAPFTIQPGPASAASSVQQEVVDLPSLYSVYRRSPAHASALLTSASPPAETLLLLFEQLLDEATRPLPSFHVAAQIRMLSICQAFLTAAVSVRVSSPSGSSPPPVLAAPHLQRLSYTLQALSSHAYPEYRIIAADCALTVCSALCLSASLPPVSTSLQSCAASLCVLTAEALDTLTAMGRVAMERAADEDEAVRRLWRETLTWCGLRLAAAEGLGNGGREWKEDADRAEAERRSRRQREEERIRSSMKAADRERVRDGRRSSAEQEQQETAEAEADSELLQAERSHRSSDRTRLSIGGSEDDSGGQEADGDDGEAADESELSSTPSEDERGHLSDAAKPDSDDGGVEEQDRQSARRKADALQAALKAAQSSGVAELKEEKASARLSASVRQRSPTARTRTAVDAPRLLQADVDLRPPMFPSHSHSGDDDGGEDGDEDDEEEEDVNGEGEHEEVKQGEEREDGEEEAVASGRASPAVSPLESDRLPLPSSLWSSPWSVFSFLLRCRQSDGFESRQLELALSSLLTAAEALTDGWERGGEDGKQRGRPGSRREERKQQQDDAASNTDWLHFCLCLHHAYSVSSAVPSLALLSFVSSSSRLRAYYALSSVCKQLIRSHLKSPYGKEVATLSHLDRLLSQSLHVRHGGDRKEPTEEAAEGAERRQLAASGRLLSLPAVAFSAVASSSRSLHVLLLFFLLQKFVLLAASPSLSSFAASSSPLSRLFFPIERGDALFFQQNAAACLTFFSRSLPKLLSLAVSIADHHAIVVFGTELMRSLRSSLAPFITRAARTQLQQEGEEDARAAVMDSAHCLQVKELIKCACSLSYALQQLGAVEQLEELRLWVDGRCILLPLSFLSQYCPPVALQQQQSGVERVHLHRLLPFLAAMRLQAEGRYEEALVGYQSLLLFPPPSSPSSSSRASPARYVITQSSRRLVRRCIRHCFAAAHDWTRLGHWLQLKDVDSSKEERALCAAWKRWGEETTAGAGYSRTADMLRLSINQSLLSTETTGTAVSASAPSSSPSPSPLPSSPAAAAGDDASPVARQTAEAVLLLEPTSRAELVEQSLLLGLISAASHDASSLPSPSFSLTHTAAAAAADAAPVQALKQLQQWDVGSALALDGLLHSSAAMSPLSASPFSSPPALSSLLHLSCTASLAQRSLALLRPLFASYADPVVAAAVRLEDCMAAIAVVQSLSASAASSPSPLAAVDWHSSRSFLLCVARRALELNNYSLFDRLVSMDAALPLPASLTHRSEQLCLSALCAVSRGQDAEAQLIAVWEMLERMSSPHRNKLTPSPSIAPVIPISLSPSAPSSSLPDAGQPDQALLSSRFLNCFELVSRVCRVDNAMNWRTKRQLGLCALQLVGQKLSSSHAGEQQASSSASPRSPSSALLWLQSHSLSSACRLAPQSGLTWLLYGRWCERQRQRLTRQAGSSSSSNGSSAEMQEDEDWAAIHRVVSAYASLSSGDSGETVTTAIFRSMLIAVDTALQARAAEPSAPASAAPPLSTSLNALLSSALAAVFADDDSGDSVSLPASFLRGVAGVAERRARSILAFSRAALGSLVSSLLHCPASSTASFQHAVDVPLLLLSTALSSPLPHSDLLQAAVLSLPASCFLFILPQIVAALSSLLCAEPPLPTSRFASALLRTLVVRLGEELPDAVVFPLSVRLRESARKEKEGWSRIVQDIDSRQAAAIVDRAKAAQPLSRIMPAALLAAVDYSLLLPLPASSPSVSSSSPPAPSAGSFSLLLSSVDALVSGLSLVGCLPEDRLLAGIRAIQSDLPARLRFLLDELEEEKEEMADGGDEGKEAAAQRDIRRADNFRLVLAPLVAQLQKLPQLLSSASPTPHELLLRRRWSRTFASLSSMLTSPSPSSLSEPLRVGQQLAEQLTVLKRGLTRTHRLSLAATSPSLAALRHTDIRLPGLLPASLCSSPPPASPSSCQSLLACLAAFSSSLEIIRTKTRPKRLTVLGSDGLSYPFLLKSREDLHVDARIMQTVDAVNMGLVGQRRSCAAKHCLLDAAAQHHCVSAALYAPTYAVLPLSSSLGLLRWVEDATPVFDLYRMRRRKERDRDRAGDRDKGRHRQPHRDKQAGGTLRHRQQQERRADREAEREAREPRANELYQQKVLAYLTEAGLSSRMPRRDWPLAILRRVYAELARDVPQDMVDGFLSFLSSSPQHLLAMRAAFCSSLASMSAVGHVLGIGDRHLGNMLIHHSGRLLHIDYNVSLDRGRRLPVPEIVPFRLTAVLAYAAGDSADTAEQQPDDGGGGGIGPHRLLLFRSHCVSVLGWMRENSRALLSLLSTFVQCPVTDWRSDSATTRRGGREEWRSQRTDAAIATSLLQQRLSRRRQRLDAMYAAFVRLLQPVDASRRRITLLDGVVQKEGRGERAEAEREELRLLLQWEMEAMAGTKQQQQQRLMAAQRKAATVNTAAQREELERQRSQLEQLASQYETATDILQALASSASSALTPAWLVSLSDTYKQEQSDWLRAYLPCLSPLLVQQAALIRSLRPLLSIIAKQRPQTRRARDCHRLRFALDSLQRAVVALSADCSPAVYEEALRGGAQEPEEGWAAGAGAEWRQLVDIVLEVQALLEEAQAWQEGEAEEEQEAEEEGVGQLDNEAERAEAEAAAERSRQTQYAMEAVRRVEEKLAGVEPGAMVAVEDGGVAAMSASSPLSVRQHVDWLIAEATRVDNLCRMYEGWAAWI